MPADLTWPSDRMAKFIDVTPRRLQQLVSEGVIQRESTNRYNPFVVTVSYIRWLRDQKGGLNGSEKEDEATRLARDARRRRNLADAESAEIENMKKKGMFVLKVHHANAVQDLATQTRVAVEREPSLTKDQRKKLLKAFRDIKPNLAEAAK